MKPAFRIILALSFSLAACGQSKPELFLDRTTTALECGSANAPDCVAADYADAGAPRPELDECYGDGDCEYGEVCERRHGVSRCQPEEDRHGDEYGGDDGYGGENSSSDDDSYGHGGHGGDDRPDGGSACEPSDAADDQPKSSYDCQHDDDRYEEDRYDDRSGSNSGRH